MNTHTSHSIRISCISDNPHCYQSDVEVACDGDGGIEHWLQTVKAAMVAAGFSASLAGRLNILPPAGFQDVLELRASLREPEKYKN